MNSITRGYRDDGGESLPFQEGITLGGVQPQLSRQEALQLAQSYKRFLVLLFAKITGCFDSSLSKLPNVQSLTFSRITESDIIFRCGSYMEIYLPKSFPATSISLAELDALPNDWNIRLNDVEIPIEVWMTYQFDLHEVKATVEGVTHGVEQEIADIIRSQKKDRTLKARISRLDKKLLPPPIHQSGPSIDLVSNKPKLSMSKNPRLPILRIEKR